MYTPSAVSTFGWICAQYKSSYFDFFSLLPMVEEALEGVFLKYAHFITWCLRSDKKCTRAFTILHVTAFSLLNFQSCAKNMFSTAALLPR
jgi:hypothetical protein